MTFLGLIKSVFSFINGVLGEIRDRRLMKAGRDAVNIEQLEETLHAVEEKNALDRELNDPDARKRLRERHYRD